MQNILNKLHKFTSAQEPMKVEFAESAEDIVSVIKRFSLSEPLKKASQAQKLLKEASDIALYTSEIYEKRLKRAKEIISIGEKYGLFVGDVKEVIPMAEKQIQDAKNLYKALNDAQGRVLTSY